MTQAPTPVALEGHQTSQHVRQLIWRHATGRFAWFVLGVVTTLGVFGLRDLVFPPPPHNELVILSGVDQSAGGQRQVLVDRWNELHPDQTARIEPAGDDADKQHSHMVGEAQSGASGVDIYNLDVIWIAEFAAAGYIRPLDEDSIPVKDFIKATVDTCRYDSKLWALPFNTDAALLYYNTNVFGRDQSKANLPNVLPPRQNDMTAMELANPGLKAGFVTQLYGYEGLTVNALEAIWAANGDILDANNQVVIDHKAALDGLAALANGLEGQPPAVLSDSKGYREGQSRAAFRRGDAALMRNWPVAYSQLKADPAMKDFDVAPWPTPSVLGGQNLAIASDSRNPRAAQELIEFLTSEESQRQLFRDGGLPATRNAVYGDPTVVAARPYAEDLLDAFERARPRPLTPHYALFSSVFQKIVVYALNNHGRLPDNAVSQLTAALQGRRE